MADPNANQPYDLSDLGNAQILAELHSDKLKFNHTSGEWLIWNGQYWEKDNRSNRYNYATDVSKYRQNKSIKLERDKEKVEMLRYGIRCGDKVKIDAMLKVAATLPEIATVSDNWDKDELVFQCKNGILLLNTGDFIEGKPGHMNSQCSGVFYDPDATSPIFDRFIVEVMNGDRELTDYLLMALGYSLSGLTDEQCMFILDGDGANGKSVLLDLMAYVFGDYLVHTRFDAFLKKFNSTSTNDLARLSKARMVKANESGVGKNWDEERIKEITGGDKITARFLYREYFDYRSRVKLWCATNHLPKTNDYSDAFWRRMIVIPFERKFKGDGRNPNILSELKRESSGILNRLFQGFQKWTNSSLKSPPIRVNNAATEYKTENDVVAQWVEEAGVKNGGGNFKLAKIVYQAYVKWHEKNGAGNPVSQRMFGKRMNSFGLESIKKSGNRVYVGLQFTEQD